MSDLGKVQEKLGPSYNFGDRDFAIIAATIEVVEEDAYMKGKTFVLDSLKKFIERES